MHDPDLIIRTSGEQRLSNYLLWQSAYSELYFTDVLWPDFSRADLEAALRRVRRAPAPLRRAADGDARARARQSAAPARARRRGARRRTCCARILVAIPAIAFAIFDRRRGRLGLRARRARARRASACTSCSACTSGCGRCGWPASSALGRARRARRRPAASARCCSRSSPSCRSCSCSRSRCRRAAGATRPRAWRSRRSASSGSAWRSRTPCCCATCRTATGIVIDVLVGTFIGDTGAYLGGRSFGTRPLAPRISPNKTVEGLVIGLLAAVLGDLVRRALPGLAVAAARRCCSALAVGARGAARRPVRVARQARRGHQGRRRAVRRPRRRAGPARRRVLHARRGLLRVAGAAVSDETHGRSEARSPDDRAAQRAARGAARASRSCFAFLLTVPFTAALHDSSRSFQRDVFYVTLIATALCDGLPDRAVGRAPAALPPGRPRVDHRVGQLRCMIARPRLSSRCAIGCCRRC